MTPVSTPLRVLFIGDSGPVLQQITTALSTQSEFQLTDVLSSTERLVREVYAAEPHLILVDYLLGGSPTVDIIDELTLQYPKGAIVAILPQNDPAMIQQVVLAGARAFLVQPFTQLNLLSTLRRLYELESRRVKAEVVASTKAEEFKPLRSLVVFSPRGGVGCSTIASNLAIALCEKTGGRVLLLEGKLSFGHLDVLLNIRARNSLADLIPHASALDESLVRDVIYEHSSGIYVLIAPKDLQTAQGIRPDDLYSAYLGLQKLFEYIIVDGGNLLTENTVTLMDSSDRVLLITTPDLAALHDTSRFIQISRSLGYPNEKLMIILNRAGLPGGVKTRDIEAALHHPVFADIPEDGPNAVRSLNRGIPLVIRYPRSPASKAIKMLSQRLIQINAAETAWAKSGAAPAKSQQEALMASSQLG